MPKKLDTISENEPKSSEEAEIFTTPIWNGTASGIRGDIDMGKKQE